jgi:hypothetical protein
MVAFDPGRETLNAWRLSRRKWQADQLPSRPSMIGTVVIEQGCGLTPTVAHGTA